MLEMSGVICTGGMISGGAVLAFWGVVEMGSEGVIDWEGVWRGFEWISRGTDCTYVYERVYFRNENVRIMIFGRICLKARSKMDRKREREGKPEGAAGEGSEARKHHWVLAALSCRNNKTTLYFSIARSIGTSNGKKQQCVQLQALTSGSSCL